MENHQTIQPGWHATALNESESLIVRTWRKLLSGHGNCPVIARDFMDACGTEAVEVLATFGTVLRALAYASRRRVSIGYPGCGMITNDERQLLTLIAAAQAEDEACFEAHLRWMARADLRQALAIAVSAFATALREHGHYLPLPIGMMPDASGGAAAPLRVLCG
jgi:hypothetical protein